MDEKKGKNKGKEKGIRGKVVFKPYLMEQLRLPMSLDDLIPENHLVRVVNSAIERMDIEPLLEQYKGGGTSSYHPKMMLKVIVYAYIEKIYSSRRIAKALRENINFMWLSGNNRPDFRTINRFRSEVMKEVVDKTFASVLETLIEKGYVKVENYFVDGTKIEANASRYSYVWSKSTKKHKQRVQEKIKELLKQIDRVDEEENEEYGDRDLEELGEGINLDPAELERKIEELNEKLKKKPDKQQAKAVKMVEKVYLPRLRKYEEQEAILGGRNSYSKTDPDATFMRMKDDHLQNGQLKPAYNVQLGTENQFILGFSIHQRPGDSTCLIHHLEHVKNAQLGKLPQNIIADAGYGSEENYEYLVRHGLGNYVKYNTFHLERTRKFKNDPFRVENLLYDECKDEYICPAGKRMRHVKVKRTRTINGYLTEQAIYECEDCSGCLLKEKCTKSKGNRQIQVNKRLQKLRQEAACNLCSEKGKLLRARRSVEVESVFGRLKHDCSFRRFMLRGIEKVKTEFGLLCIAHNIAKMAAVMR
jgi:transposase